jgi:hypothetical protein
MEIRGEGEKSGKRSQTRIKTETAHVLEYQHMGTFQHPSRRSQMVSSYLQHDPGDTVRGPISSGRGILPGLDEYLRPGRPLQT